LRYRVPPDSHG